MIVLTKPTERDLVGQINGPRYDPRGTGVGGKFRLRKPATYIIAKSVAWRHEGTKMLTLV